MVFFLHALPTWVHGRGLHPLHPPVPLPAAREAQRVKDYINPYSYSYGLDCDEVRTKMDKKPVTAFRCFMQNFFKDNADKWHFLSVLF